jgi:hypothetical protein
MSSDILSQLCHRILNTYFAVVVIVKHGLKVEGLFRAHLDTVIFLKWELQLDSLKFSWPRHLFSL